MKKSFALIGAAGYIASRHFQAIKETDNELVAALDPHDSVGILDSYFPECSFFTEFERFDRHLEKLKRNGAKIDYLVICSPNYLHDAHIRFGLKHGADVICEKPIVLNPRNLLSIKDLEKETEHTVYPILQLRFHPTILKLKELTKNEQSKKHIIKLTYIVPRGLWYYSSWKGDYPKSGGIASNIGIHFFDMLISIFGEVIESTVQVHQHDCASGYLQLKRANIQWFLSINKNHLPSSHLQNSLRSLIIDGNEFDFSDGFEKLHTISYHNILNGVGPRISSCETVIQLISNIRKSKIQASKMCHPLLKNIKLNTHPFN